jgi:hypothetical protein
MILDSAPERASVWLLPQSLQLQYTSNETVQCRTAWLYTERIWEMQLK